MIFFLGDGMGPTTVTASRIYKYGEAGKLNMEQLSRTARVKTFSNDAQTTDSAVHVRLHDRREDEQRSHLHVRRHPRHRPQ